jgi:hypothetical protein
VKKILLVLATLTSLNANASLVCIDFAEKKAAEFLEMTLEDFRAENGLIFSCKHRRNPKVETIQFGDGSGLVGVELKIVRGNCVVTDIYSGQDDQDLDDVEVQEACLPN